MKWYENYKINDFTTSVYESEKYRIKRIAESNLGKMSLLLIKPINIQSYVNELQQELSLKSIYNLMLLLKGCLKQAVLKGFIPNNPAENITIKYQDSQEEKLSLDDTTKQVFLKHAITNPYYDFYVIALCTGMRLSEITGLTTACISLEPNNEIIIVKQQLKRINKEYVLTKPKTKKSIRHVPMIPIVKDIITKYLNSQIKYENFLFQNPTTNGLLTSDVLYRNIKKIYKKLMTKQIIHFF